MTGKDYAIDTESPTAIAGDFFIMVSRSETLLPLHPF